MATKALQRSKEGGGGGGNLLGVVRAGRSHGEHNCSNFLFILLINLLSILLLFNCSRQRD
jgi:hypothetical protein